MVHPIPLCSGELLATSNTRSQAARTASSAIPTRRACPAEAPERISSRARAAPRTESAADRIATDEAFSPLACPPIPSQTT